MHTYILIAIGFGLALCIAIAGIRANAPNKDKPPSNDTEK